MDQAGSYFGCDDFDSAQDDCSTALTDNTFTFDGVEYTVNNLWNRRSAGINRLAITFDKAFPGSAHLTVDLNRSFRNNIATYVRQQGGNVVGRGWRWNDTGLAWADNQQVLVRLVLVAGPAGLSVGAGDGQLALAWTSSGAGTYDVHYTSAPKWGDGAVADNAAVQTGGSATAADGWVATSVVSVPAQTIRSLTNGTTYRVRVRSRGTAGSTLSAWTFGTGVPRVTLSALTGSTSTDGSTFDGALALSPAFAATTNDYTATVASAVTHVKLTPTVGRSNHRVSVGNNPTVQPIIASGAVSQAMALKVGANVIRLGVIDARGRLVRWYTVTVTRRAAQVSTAPTGLTVTAGDAELRAAWTAPAGVDVGRYEVQIKLKSAASWPNTDTDVSSGTSHTFTGLVNGSPYQVRVRTVPMGGDDVSDWTTPAEGTPRAAGSTPTVTLSASPNPVDEGSSVTVTATLSAALSSQVTIPLMIADDTAEPEDHGTLADITIASGATVGTGTITTAQDADTEDETFTVALGTLPSGVTAGSPDSVRITIRDAAGGGGGNVGGGGGGGAPDLVPGFGTAAVAAQEYTEGAAIPALRLPAATGGDGTLTYRLTPSPPPGLALDAGTRTLSGAPESAQGPVRYAWTATDADGDAATLSFTIAVAADPVRAAVRGSVKRALAAVARRAMSGALENIGARFGDIGASGLSLAGRWVPLEGSEAVSAAMAACYGPHGSGAAVPGRAEGGRDGRFGGRGQAGCAEGWSRSMTAGELFGGSAFSLHLGASEGVSVPPGPLWSVWGRGDLGTFEGRGDSGLGYDGELRTGWVGFDARAGTWVAGLAVSHGTGEADYAFAGGGLSGEGRLETELTSIYPYGRWTLGDGLELRAVAGAGWGEAAHGPSGGARESGDLTMRMASLGVRRALPDVGGMEIALRADGSVTRIGTDGGPDAIHGLTADGWRLRAGVEASRRVALRGGRILEPFLEAAVRRDGGDGLEGSGVELAGGVRYAAPGVSVEARGRWLAAHSEDGAEETGVSVTARAGPGSDGRGLFVALSPRWGAGVTSHIKSSPLRGFVPDSSNPGRCRS